MKFLFIAEKKSLMDEIEAVYNKIFKSLPYEADFDCFAGHIIALKEPKEYTTTHPEWGKEWEEISLPMIPDTYELKVTRKDIYKRLTQKIKAGKYDYIVNACDADREGMAIFELFRKKSGFKEPVKRFWNNDLTDKGITLALKNLRDNEETALENLKKASILRGEFDWLIGMNFTIGYSLKLGGTAKVGRVQTPTLSILVQRERDILNFKPTVNYEVHSWLYIGEESIDAVYINEEKKNEKFETQEEARQFIKRLPSDQLKVLEYTEQKKKRKAPKLFKMSVLQTEGSKAFGYTAEEVLSSIQFLYEQKILTYPRTDCEFLSSEMVRDFRKMLETVKGIPKLVNLVSSITNSDIERVAQDKSYINDDKLKESGHSAIVPTGQVLDSKDLESKLNVFNKDHKTMLSVPHINNMLLLVCKRFLGIFLPEQIILSQELILESKEGLFKATGSRVIQNGYMSLYKSNEQDKTFPKLEIGEMCTVIDYENRKKTTSVPTRFTDGSLIAVMENPARYLTNEAYKMILREKKGIGTPATRAEIIKSLINNGYVKRVKSTEKSDYLQPTSQGISLIESLQKEDIVSVDITGEWEEKLKKIEMNELTESQVREEMNKFILNSIKHIQTGFFKPMNSVRKGKKV